jgi:hypothetical protein
LHNPWLAGGGGERADRARRIARAHAGFLAGEAPDGQGLRDVVAASWRRAAGAKVDPDAGPPVVLADGDLDAYRDAHPLASVIGVLRELVGGVAEDGQHLMAVADAAGQLLWVEGHRGTRRRAEAMNFVEGAPGRRTPAGSVQPEPLDQSQPRPFANTATKFVGDPQPAIADPSSCPGHPDFPVPAAARPTACPPRTGSRAACPGRHTPGPVTRRRTASWPPPSAAVLGL